MQQQALQEGNTAAPLRLVLDTNVVLNCIAFRGERVKQLIQDLETGRAQAYSSDHLRTELVEVLSYPRLRRFLPTETQRQAAIAKFDRWTASNSTAPPDLSLWHTTALPRVKDAGDQHLLDIALQFHAHYLITKDRDLLKISQYVDAFAIVTPAEYLLREHGIPLCPAPSLAGSDEGAHGHSRAPRATAWPTQMPRQTAPLTTCTAAALSTQNDCLFPGATSTQPQWLQKSMGSPAASPPTLAEQLFALQQLQQLQQQQQQLQYQKQQREAEMLTLLAQHPQLLSLLPTLTAQ